MGMIAQLVAELGPRFPFVKEFVMFCCSARNTLGWHFLVVKLRSLACHQDSCDRVP